MTRCAALLCLLLAAAASAGKPAEPPLSDAQPHGDVQDACQGEGQAPLQLAEEGLRLYRDALRLAPGSRDAARLLEAALRCYQRAAIRSQEPGKLYHPMGLAYQQLGRHAEAYEAYKRFLVEVPEASRKVGVTKQITDRLQELRNHVGELDIDTVPGLDVRVDDRAVGRSPLRGMVVVTPGSHSVTVGNPEVGTSGATVQVKAGDVLRVDLSGWRPRAAAVQGQEPLPAGAVLSKGSGLAGSSGAPGAAAPVKRPVPRWVWVVTGLAGAAAAGTAIGAGVYFGTGVPTPDRVIPFPH